MLSDRYEKIKHYWLNKLEAELPSFLSYHSADHTSNVINACSYLAEKENIPAKEKELLLVAALFHDSGFLHSYTNNESEGAKIANEVLPKFGFSETEIEIIAGIIRSTSIAVEPVGILQEIIHDADLNYLGRPDYLSRADDLRKEMTQAGISYSDVEWLQLQEQFLEKFDYITKAAQDLVQDGLEKNLNHVRNSLKEIEA